MMHWNTVNDQLKDILLRLMKEPIFNDFRLVGGTALSLQLGHRKSVDKILAMKIDVIQRGGRKKDFWDLHELMEHYSIDFMLELHLLRYEWTH